MATEKKEVKVKSFALVRELTESDKCPPQAKAIVAIVKGLGAGAKRGAILEAMKAPGVIKTGQAIERIFGFYRPRLIDMGILREDVTVTTVEVEVADKPAKAPKADAGSKAPRDKAKDVKGQKQVA